MVGCIGLVGALFGVCGALMAQRYVVSANKVREKYKALRDAYSTFVFSAHLCATVAKNLYDTDMQLEDTLHLSTPSARRKLLKSYEGAELERMAMVLESFNAETRALLMQTSHSLNARFGDASAEMFRCFTVVFMLDKSQSRRDEVRARYTKTLLVYKTLCKAKDIENAKTDHVVPSALEGIEDWIAAVSEALSCEEEEELASVSPFRG